MHSNIRLLKTILIISLALVCRPIFSQHNSSITGTIKDAQGNRLPAVNIAVKNTTIGTVSGMDGRFVLKNISQGSHIIQASSVGYALFETTVVCTSGSTTTVDIVLEATAYSIESIEVEAKSISSQINEQAYAVTSISTEKLLNSTVNVMAVLDKVPGVRIMEEGGMGSSFNFTINGFSGDQVKFFMDGLPMDNFGSALSIADIPVNMIERVDVYKGVIPVDLGSDALGGAVNIITKKTHNFLDASYSVGSFNTHKASVNFAHTNNSNGFTFRGNAFVNYSDNNYKVLVPITNGQNSIVDTANVPRFHDRYRSASLKLEAGLVSKPYADNLLFGIIAATNDKQVQHGATMSTVYGGIMRNNQSLIPTIRYSKNDFLTKGLSVKWHNALNLNQSSIIDTLRGIRYNWLGEAFKTEGSNDGEHFRTNTTMTDVEYLSQLNGTYQFNGWHHVSLNHAYNYFNRQANDVENPDYQPNQFERSLNKQVLGLAYEYRKSEKVQFTLFSKFFFLNAKTYKTVDFGLETQRTIAVSSSQNNIGFGAAGTYFPLPKLQIKASYEHTYRMPTPLELFGDGLFIEPNADIGPEQSDNLNLSLNYRFKVGKDHRFNTGGTFVYREAKDLIYTVVKVASPITFYDNLYQTRTLGFEANAQYQYKSVLQLGANLTFQDITDQAEYIYDDSYTGGGWKKNFHYKYRVPNIPYLFGSFNTGLFFINTLAKEDALNINYYLNYVEKFYLSWSKNAKYIIPQQVSHDITTSYTFRNKHYNLALECRNLLNARLYDKFYLQKPGRSFHLKIRYTI